MAGFAAIAAAGKSIERLLNVCFEESQPIAAAFTPPNSTPVLRVLGKRV